MLTKINSWICVPHEVCISSLFFYYYLETPKASVLMKIQKNICNKVVFTMVMKFRRKLLWSTTGNILYYIKSFSRSVIIYR